MQWQLTWLGTQSLCQGAVKRGWDRDERKLPQAMGKGGFIGIYEFDANVGHIRQPHASIVEVLIPSSFLRIEISSRAEA
jgi:hypothetical protein